MINLSYHQESDRVFWYLWQLQFVLSGFAQHLVRISAVLAHPCASRRRDSCPMADPS